METISDERRIVRTYQRAGISLPIEAGRPSRGFSSADFAAGLVAILMVCGPLLAGALYAR